MFTEIETSGKFYEQFKRATMSDAHADYKLTSLEEFIQGELFNQVRPQGSEEHIEAVEAQACCIELRNGNALVQEY